MSYHLILPFFPKELRELLLDPSISDLMLMGRPALEGLGEERSVTITQRHLELATVEIRADRSLMRIALMNIMHNALKFSPQGTTITIAFAHPSTSWLQISVEDEGAGDTPGGTQKSLR